jgi:hypothetical protein
MVVKVTDGSVKDSAKILLMDRSGAELDDDCGMAFFWNRVWHPAADDSVAGIVPEKEAIYFKVGRETHEDLHMVSEMEDLSVPVLEERVKELTNDLTAEDRLDLDMMERLYRRIGWFVAQALFIEPKTRDQFETIYCEDEIILDREPLWVPITPDRVLRRKSDGKLIYREYKSTAFAGQKWTGSWPFAIQLHLGMKALAEELGEPIEYAQIMGLYKGYPGRDGLSHPYVWAWRNIKTGAWTHEYARAVPRSDWERAPIWEYPDGPVKWILTLGEEVALDQFPQSPPVFLNEDMVTDWITRKTHRAKEVSLVGETCLFDHKLRSLMFEKRTKKCRPAFGDQCPYLPLCWNKSMAETPLAKGFVPRTPHHEVEILWLQERKEGKIL